jgi:hypothetical protein
MGLSKKSVPPKVTIFYHHPCSSGYLGAIWYPPISGQHPHLNQTNQLPNPERNGASQDLSVGLQGGAP